MHVESCKILTTEEWNLLNDAQHRRASEWTEPYRKRSARREIHPIYDFLFLYYRIKPSQLEVWHPGFGVAVKIGEKEESLSDLHYAQKGTLLYLDPRRIKKRTRHRLQMALDLCESIKMRPAQFGCFGMHEWAMVYQADQEGEIRHAESLPLRLSQKETDAFVRSRPIHCSHFDAFRFFSPSAKPFNRIQLAKETRIDNEQCGCLHTNMDLYKLCGQCMPWVGSDLLWRTFELAIEARTLDMRASPYDCTSLGFSAIPVETGQGRKTYERRQRELSERARPIRSELISRLKQVLAENRSASSEAS